MRFGLPALALAAVLGGAAAFGGSWVVRHAHTPPTNLHDIMHSRFELRPSERTKLEAAEARYNQRRSEIEGRIRAANAKLASVIRADPELSTDVLSASDAVENAAAELQRVTLQHIFEMRVALDSDHRAAYDDVLVDALTRDQ